MKEKRQKKTEMIKTGVVKEQAKGLKDKVKMQKKEKEKNMKE